MIGYVLLLLLGLAIAVATFVCSMGNVPVARFLKAAGVQHNVELVDGEQDAADDGCHGDGLSQGGARQADRRYLARTRPAR